MTPELLLTHFDRISDAPNAVQHLRRFVLDLAVRGKLVDQKPDDGSALELLTTNPNKGPKVVSAQGTYLVPNSQAPFRVPSNWIWVPLGDICSKTGSGSTPRGGKSVYQSSGVPFLRSQNIYDDGLRLGDVAYIDHQTHERMSGTAVQSGDLLLNITGGSIGRCCIAPTGLGEANVSQHVAIVRVAIEGLESYLHKLVLSPYFQSFVLGEQTGAGRGGLPKNRMDRIPVALPPLAEQKRIVEKVNELMGLCDRLESAKNRCEIRRDRLTSASFHYLNSEENAEAFLRHARFCLEHLQPLTAHPEQIKQLRQTVLNLSVRGKLTIQNPNDGRVSELLTRIQAEKVDLIGKTAVERESQDDHLSEENTPFEIPPEWQWATLRSIMVFGPQNGISPKPSSRPDAPKAITLTATTKGFFDPKQFKRVDAIIPEDSEFWLRSGDLLFQRGNTREYVGMAAYYIGESGKFLYPDLMMKVRTSANVNLQYIHLCAVSPYARAYFSTHATGAQATMPKINQGILVKLPIPLPPLAEQDRIVAKARKLTVLCDRLEAQLTTAQIDGSRLLESVLHHALNDEYREINVQAAVQFNAL